MLRVNRLFLSEDEYSALVKLSVAELRGLNDQIRYLLRHALQNRGLLPDSDDESPEQISVAAKGRLELADKLDNMLLLNGKTDSGRHLYVEIDDTLLWDIIDSLRGGIPR